MIAPLAKFIDWSALSIELFLAGVQGFDAGTRILRALAICLSGAPAHDHEPDASGQNAEAIRPSDRRVGAKEAAMAYRDRDDRNKGHNKAQYQDRGRQQNRPSRKTPRIAPQ